MMRELPKHLNYAWPDTLYFFPRYELGGSEELAALLKSHESAGSIAQESQP